MKTMKKTAFYLYVISIHLLYSVAFAQPASLPHNINFPASPSVAALAQYADTPVSYYSGTPSINIPLYTIETDGFSLPLSLSYSASGIKVSQEASNVGLGWSLNAGGMITRQTRGAYDFSTFTPLGYFHNRDNYEYPANEQLEIVLPQNVQTTTTHPRYITSFDVPTPIVVKDGEPDMFIYNFAGYSGKFILQSNENGKGDGILIDRKNNLTIKFRIFQGNSFFTIKDSNGTTYEFKLTETSENYFFSGPSFSANENRNVSPITDDSWLLTKVVLNNGTPINFTYKPDGRLGTVQSTLIKSQFKYQIVAAQGLPRSNSLPNDYYSQSYNIGKAFILDEISWPNGLIKFTTSNRLDLIHGLNQKIDKIEVFSKINNLEKLVKHYDLKYNYFKDDNTNEKDLSWRLKLTSLLEQPITNIENIKPKKHVFGYDETFDLPPKTSNDYDHWGYYNKANNKKENIVPEKSDPDEQIKYLEDITERILNSGLTPKIPSNLDLLFAGANREPRLDAARSGILNQIQYPTGGVENFEYELNTYIREEDDNEEPYEYTSNRASIGFAYDPGTGENPFNSEDPFTITGEVISYDLRFGYSQETLEAMRNRAFYQSNNFRIEIWKGSQMITSFLCSEPFSSDYNITGSVGCQKNFLENLEPGNYTLRLSIPGYLSNGTYSGIVVNGGINFKEKIMLDNTSGNQPAQNLLGGGLRISKITSEKNIREFNYNDNSNKSTGILLGKYNYYALKENRFYGDGSSQEANAQRLGKVLSSIRQSNSNYPLSGGITGNIIGYSKVRERIIDPSKPNRFIQNIYYFNNKRATEKRWGLPNDEDISNGKLIKKQHYANELLVKSEENIYRSFFGPTIIFGSNFNSDLGITNEYAIETAYHDLLSVKTMDLLLYGSDFKKLYTEESYFYNFHDYISQRRLIQKKDSKGDTYQTTIKYPQDDHDVPSNLSHNSIKSKLVQQHRYGTPLYTKTEIKKKDESTYTDLSHQYTVFKDWGDNANATNKLILPQIQQSLKGKLPSDFKMEDNIVFSKYDKYGNPEEASLKDGISFIYIWGYNHQYPIAKIENASYTGMPSAIRTLINQVKTDSNIENSIAKETSLRSKLENLRTHSFFANAQMSYYTYDPLIGVTSITDPRGYTMTYYYDEFNRLEFVKDQDGNLVSENKYNYKN